MPWTLTHALFYARRANGGGARGGAAPGGGAGASARGGAAGRGRGRGRGGRAARPQKTLEDLDAEMEGESF
jgi:THO complex subunit 4